MIEHPVADIRQMAERLIELGEIKAAFGIKGWLKIFSYTRPIEQIFEYSNWLIGDQAEAWQIQATDTRSNNGLIVKLKGVDDRNAAQSLIGKPILVAESELAELADDEYYWSQLIGLKVINSNSEYLGQVTGLIETGANDVLVLEDGNTERLIPYADSIVIKVDINDQTILVEWEKEY